MTTSHSRTDWLAAAFMVSSLEPLAIATFAAGDLKGSLILFREYHEAHPEDLTISKFLGAVESALDEGS